MDSYVPLYTMVSQVQRLSPSLSFRCLDAVLFVGPFMTQHQEKASKATKHLTRL